MVRNLVGHVHQQNAVTFETISTAGARQGPIITGLEGDIFLAILILIKQKIIHFPLLFLFSPIETEKTVNGK